MVLIIIAPPANPNARQLSNGVISPIANPTAQPKATAPITCNIFILLPPSLSTLCSSCAALFLL